MTQSIIIICIAVFIGAFIQASIGFGFAIVTMAVIPLFIQMTDSLMLLFLCSTIIVGYLAIRNIRYVNYKLLIVPLIFTLIGNYVGLLALVNTDNELAVKLLGGLLILFSIYFFLFSDKVKLPNNQISASIAGIISGVISGFFNIPGPPMVLYYSVAIKDKKAYFATLQMLFFISVLFKIVLFLITEEVSETIKPIIPFAVLFSVLGLILGIYFFNRLSSEKVKKMVYIFMTLAGIWYIVR